MVVVSDAYPGDLCGCCDCPGPDDLCSDCVQSVGESGRMVTGACGGKCTEDAQYSVVISVVASADPVSVLVCDRHSVEVGAVVLESLFPVKR